RRGVRRPAVAAAQGEAGDRGGCRQRRARRVAAAARALWHARDPGGGRRRRRGADELVRAQARVRPARSRWARASRGTARMTLWHLILLASIAVLAIKLLGYAVPPRLFDQPRPRRTLELLTVSLLAGLVAVQTLGGGEGIVLDARI